MAGAGGAEGPSSPSLGAVLEAWPPSVQGAGSLPWRSPGPEARGAWPRAEAGPGPCRPLTVSVAMADCGLSGPWFLWVMMAVCGRAALVSTGLERLCRLLPKAASAAAAGGWARVPPASAHGWPSAAQSPSQPAPPRDAQGPTRGILLASRPLSCPCPAESLPDLLPWSPGQPVPARGLSIPACCPRADWGADLGLA